MNLINHGEINKKIESYLESKGFVGVDVDSSKREKELAKLGLMFGNYFAISGYLKKFKKIETGANTFYYYDTVAVDKLKQISYMAVCEDNKPLFLTSYTEFGTEDTKYTEQSFSTYDKDTNRLISRVRNNLLIIGHSAELDVKLLDTKDNEYYRKHYKFYYDIDRIVAYQIGDDKFLNTKDYRLELAINRVENVSDRIRNKIDEDLGINQDYIKEYRIKRKNI